jgi:hypothetical protein
MILDLLIKIYTTKVSILLDNLFMKNKRIVYIKYNYELFRQYRYRSRTIKN